MGKSNLALALRAAAVADVPSFVAETNDAEATGAVAIRGNFRPMSALFLLIRNILLASRGVCMVHPSLCAWTRGTGVQLWRPTVRLVISWRLLA